MKNHFGIAACAALLVAASSSSFAAEQGAFFINGNLGQSNFHDHGFSNHTDTSSALRAGYYWQSDVVDFGVEGGYVNLGQAGGSVSPYGMAVNYSAKVTGPLLGANMKYKFRNRMFVSARAGWFRSKFEVSADNLVSQSVTGNGAYSGVGVGYDINSHFSLGVNFDEYHGRATIYGTKAKEGISSLSGFAEYRF